MGKNKQGGSTDESQHLKTQAFPSVFSESRQVVFLFITIFSKTCFSRQELANIYVFWLGTISRGSLPRCRTINERSMSLYILTPRYYFSHTQNKSISSLFLSELSTLPMYHPFIFPPDYTSSSVIHTFRCLSDPPALFLFLSQPPFFLI